MARARNQVRHWLRRSNRAVVQLVKSRTDHSARPGTWIRMSQLPVFCRFSGGLTAPMQLNSLPRSRIWRRITGEMCISNQVFNNRESRTKNRKKQMGRDRVKASPWLLGFVLCLLLWGGGESVLAQETRQQDASAVPSNDVVSFSPAPSLAEEHHNVDWFPKAKPAGLDLAAVAFFMVALLTGYSLLTAGKRGWGWWGLMCLAGAAGVFLKLFLAMFVEVTSEYCPPDWDED